MLFDICVRRAFCAHPVEDVLARAPEAALERLFAPLRDTKDPLHAQVRRWLAGTAHSYPTLRLRGRFEVSGTSPARSVTALADCDELVLRHFDVTELVHAQFTNLVRLSICLPAPATAVVSVDGIAAPALKNISLVLQVCDAEQDVQTLFDFLNTKTVRRCRSVSVAHISFAAMPFYELVRQLPFRHRKARIEHLRFEVWCAKGWELLFLHRVWASTIHTLVLQAGKYTEDLDVGVCFPSVRVLGLLPRPFSDWTLQKAATLCAIYFPRVEKVAVVCAPDPISRGLPAFFLGARGVFFGAGHPLNRGDPDLRRLVGQ